jgi:hypothetical protein
MLIGDKSIGAGVTIVGGLLISGVALIVAVDAKLTDVIVALTARAVFTLVDGCGEDACVFKAQETRIRLRTTKESEDFIEITSHTYIQNYIPKLRNDNCQSQVV